MKRPPRRTAAQNHHFKAHGRPVRPTLDQWLDDYALRLAESRRRLDDLGGGRREWSGG